MSHSEQRMAMIREKLEAAFAPESLKIIDESHKHAGHASAKGGGHYIVQIVSNAFEGKNPVQRHRMVYAAMGDLIPTEVHALSIQADTPTQ
jgi:BolA protein